ncbi:MAG: hypothetical protein KGH76_00960 [Thaumarchaeota archaeon]|nr:hypothetical protein [Nitrososphaerota archaeon]
MNLSEDFDKQKMMETLTDPDVSSILVELEKDGKSSTYLADKLQLSVDQIKNRLSYLIKYNFVLILQTDGDEFLQADLNKLNKIMENDENFTNVIDGLTELDQFLN